jgi:hypothetical protein
VPLFLFPGLAIVGIGLLGFAILASNHYYSSGHLNWFQYAVKSNIILRAALYPFNKVAQLFTQILSHWMAQAVEATDAAVGTAFHYIANEIKQTGDTLLQFSAFALTVAQAVTGQVTWREVAAQLRQLRATIRHAEHAAEVAGARAVKRERAITQSIAQGVYPRIRAIEHEIAKPIQHEIKSARALAREAEDEALKAYKVARHALARTSIKALAIALPAVIARLGWDWIKCKEARNLYNKRGCNMWSDLDGLLGLALAALAFSDLQELLKVAEEIEGDVIALAKDALSIP